MYDSITFLFFLYVMNTCSCAHINPKVLMYGMMMKDGKIRKKMLVRCFNHIENPFLRGSFKEKKMNAVEQVYLVHEPWMVCIKH